MNISKIKSKVLFYLRRGICLRESEMMSCYEHEDCDEGYDCVVGFCGEKKYFEAIKNISCEKCSVCQVQKLFQDYLQLHE